MFYPFKFQPLYKDYIWGGRNLTTLGKSLPEGKVAESWELSCHPDGQSIIANGPYKDTTLDSLIKKFGQDAVGHSLPASAIEKFPLLIKFIDANDRLSVQVHPEDAYAIKHENGDLGKNEMWYIISAKEDARIVYGVTPETTRESFGKAVAEGRINECLNYMPVKAGDFVNIPAGLVHAIGAGIVLAEVQQNSNTTYRVYDYDRIDKNGNKRALHVEKALEVIDFDCSNPLKKVEGLFIEKQDYSKSVMIVNDYFAIEQYKLQGSIRDTADGSKFYIYIFTEGSGSIKYAGGEIAVSRGETVFVPAAMGEFTIEGQLEMIKSYVPDKNEVINRLVNDGFAKEEIISSVAGLK
jgi:mannose-6-phosphate isomerase